MKDHRRLAAAACGLILLLAGCGSGGGGGTGSGGSQSDSPQLTSVSPTSQTAGTGAFTLSATGSNFATNSVIQWNGSALTTTFVSATSLTAQVPGSDVAAGGNEEITVSTSGAGGGTSGAVPFTVNNLAPKLGTISPNNATVGSSSFTLTATGTAFAPNAQLSWNGVALSTTYVSATQLTAEVPSSEVAGVSSVQVTVANPTPGGGQSSGVTFYVTSGTTRLVGIPANANDIVWDAGDSRIYASLPSASNASGNSIVVINPVTGTMDTIQAASNGPNLLALSSDGSYLWVGEDGSNAVQRFSLPSLTPDITIPLPPPTIFGPTTAIALEAAPGSPHTVAVLEGNIDTDASDVVGAFIYDDTAERPVGVLPFAASGPFSTVTLSWMQWGANASTLYGGNSLIPPEFYSMDVGTSGVVAQDDYTYALNGNGHFDAATGYLYGDDGQVVNPVTGEAVGNFNVLADFSYYTICTVDSSQGVVFFFGEFYNVGGFGGVFGIEAFDQKTFKLLRTLVLPDAGGVPVNFIRWGNAGLAINFVPLSYAAVVPFNGSIYLIDGSFVNSAEKADLSSGQSVDPLPNFTSINPQSATAGSGNVTLTVTGSNFEPGSMVTFGKDALITQFVSPTELQATIPAADLATAGREYVFVSNGDDTTLTQEYEAFYITPTSSGFIPVNLACLDVAWDSKSALLYAAVWSADPQYPDSIVGIDPTSGNIVNSHYAGPDPDLVRTTADGAYVYSATANSDTVTQYRLPGLTSPLTWRLGLDSPSTSFLPLGSMVAADLQPAPGASETTAISTEAPGAYEGAGLGVIIFDNNVARRTEAFDTFAQGNSYSGLQWGLDASTLYAENPLLYTLSVNSSGATQSNQFYEPEMSAMHFDPGTGYLYLDGGQVIDPATGNVLGDYSGTTNLTGDYNSLGLMVPESSLNLVYFLGQTVAQLGTTNYTITSFNQKTFAPVGSITIPSLVGLPIRFIRWGASGFAVVSTLPASESQGSYAAIVSPPGMLYILNDPSFVSADQAAVSQKHPPERVRRTWARPQLPIASPAHRKNVDAVVPSQVQTPH